MKRTVLLSLALALGCSSAPESTGDLPTWSPERRAVAAKQSQIHLQALVLEIPARGLSEVHTGPLDMGVLNTALETPGARVLQSPSLVATPEQPASLFVGEQVGGQSVGLRLEFETEGKGKVQGRFTLTDLKQDGTPYEAAKASFEFELGERPLQVEVPGQRLVPSGDEFVLQDRVFLIVIEGR